MSTMSVSVSCSFSFASDKCESLDCSTMYGFELDGGDGYACNNIKSEYNFEIETISILFPLILFSLYEQRFQSWT